MELWKQQLNLHGDKVIFLGGLYGFRTSRCGDDRGNGNRSDAAFSWAAIPRAQLLPQH